MPYEYTLTTVIPATPQQIYDAWLDSRGHSEMTGSTAEMSDEPGADVSAWGGYIRGRNLELVPAERIVQSWRTSKFTDEHDDSVITVLLEETGDGTLLTLIHSNVPDGQTSYEQGGWQRSYFEPMTAYFANAQAVRAAEPASQRKPGAGRKPAKRSAATSKRAAARAKTPKRRAAARPKAKPKAKAKPRRTKRAARKPARRKHR
jgi:uncharacterized protein YndB with AHSA1/START domain